MQLRISVGNSRNDGAPFVVDILCAKRRGAQSSSQMRADVQDSMEMMMRGDRHRVSALVAM